MNKNNGMTRRKFVTTSLAASAGLAAGLNGFASGLQAKKSDMKVGLYSITLLGIWFRGEGATLEEVIRVAKNSGFDGVEFDGKRPHANPLDCPTKRCRELKALADDQGVPIYGIAANNDFSSPMPEFRESQIAYVKELVRMTSDMGARTLRLFLAWPGVTRHPQVAQYEIAKDIWAYTHQKFSEEEIWGWCRDSMAEVTKYAEDAGVMLALQNHAPVIRDYPDVLRMVREINSPNLKVSLDVWAIPDKSPENLMRAAKAVGDLQVVSHFGDDINDRNAAGKVTGDEYYPHFIKAMNEIAFSGYLGYELCHPLPVENGQTVGIEYAKRKAQEACEFMKGVIKDVTRSQNH